MATFVLVHGAWHGGWCWRKVTPLLRAAGHEVYTPTLTGLGERAHLASPAVDLSTHVEDVVSVLTYEDMRDVILVGHSYAGMVITGVAERAGDRLRHLVYFDAFVPEGGQSMTDLFPRREGGRRRDERPPEEEAWQITIDRARALRDWGVTDPADVEWMLPRLVPHPRKTWLQPVEGSSAAARLPRTYIHCLNKPAGDVFAAAAAMAREPGSGWRFKELPTGHHAMVTMPRELADLLLEAV